MLNKILNNRILALALLAVMFFSYMTQSAASKYVYNRTGRAMSSLISANVFTDVFFLDNDAFIVDGTEVDSVTSKNLFGLGVTNGTITDYNPSYDLDSVNNKIFVVQNNSEYDLVACFDILVCLGAITTEFLDPKLGITITEQNSGTSLKVDVKKDGDVANGEAPLIAHAENQGEVDSGNYQAPIINCTYDVPLLFWSVNYRAYSTTINPANYKDILSDEKFKDFILIPSGQSKTFVLQVDPTGTDIFGYDKNAYASMTMTCVKYEEPTT